MLAEVGEFPPMSRRRHARRFRAWFAEELRARRLTGYIATDERGRPWGAGLVWLQPRQPGLSSARKFTPYIFSMYTEPEFRRRGVASAVVRALVDWARRRGYTRVDLQATPAGRPVYERLGFRPTSHMRLELPGPHRGR